MPAGAAGVRRAIWWVRNDLRLHDNATLAQAAQWASDGVLPVFIFDTRLFGPAAASRELKIARHSPRRCQFLLDAVDDLRRRLHETYGAPLVVRTGEPAAVLRQVADEAGATTVFTGRETCPEELHTDRRVRDAGLALHTVWDSTLLHLDDLPMEDAAGDLPLTFTQFRRKVEAQWEVRPVLHPRTVKPVSFAGEEGEIPGVPELCGGGAAPEPDERAVLQFTGGETAALARVESYLWDGDHLSTYKETRNGMVGADYSSKFSAWLSQGSLSPRHVYHEVKRYERERVANKSTYWLVFELLWRDFFQFLPLRVGASLFHLRGPQGKAAAPRPWVHDSEAFQRWCRGTTGYPIVDANMRELAATGFMSNRGRQIVASFLTKDLGIDWRWGAEYFEMQLLDHRPESNYGNWTYSAGVGTDPREDRYFNLAKQASSYDRDGSHARRWIPELASAPQDYVHSPDRLSPAQRSTFQLGDYAAQRCPQRLGAYSPRQLGFPARPAGGLLQGNQRRKGGGKGKAGGSGSGSGRGPGRGGGRDRSARKY